MEISKLNEEVKRLKGQLRSHDQGIKALMAVRIDLVDQVMSWEAEEITTRDSLKEAELSRGEDIANGVDEALAKFKISDKFVVLLKKHHDTRFDAQIEVIFYNIWTYYQDLDYSFLGGELTDLIGEWIEEGGSMPLTLHCHLSPLVLRLKMQQRSRLCRPRFLNSRPLLKWMR